MVAAYPHADGADSNNRRFFFVNKTGQSANLSRSFAKETTSIQRHVQTGRKRSRPAKQAHFTTSASSGRTSLDASDILEQTSECSLPRADQIKRPTTVHPVLNPRRGASTEATREYVPHLSYQNVLHRRDPFNATSIPLNQAIGSLLYYYMHRYHPSQWPSDPSSLRPGVYVHKSAVVSIMRQAVVDKLTMYCVLSAASCRFQYIDKLKGAAPPGSETYFIHMALQLFAPYVVQAKLQDTEQLTQCLTCMMFLSSAEAYRGNVAAAKIHLEAVRQVLQPMGGLAAVKDECLQGQIAMTDLYFACHDLKTCHFDCPYDPGSASSLCLTDYDLQAPPPTCTASALLSRPDSFITIELRVMIGEVLESHTVRTAMATSLISADRATQITQWITLRDMTIRNKLLALKASDSRSHCLRVAIIMWTLLRIPTGRAKTVKDMARSLRSVLSKLSASVWTYNEEVRFWIVLVGFCCAADGSAEYEWFLRHCCSFAGHHITKQAKTASVSHLTGQLEDFQNLFLYDSITQRSRTVGLARILQGVEVDEI